MKKNFRDFFTFNKRERNGVFVLISIIFILVLYLNISSRFVSQEPFNFEKFDKDVDRFRASVKEKDFFSETPPKYNASSVKATERFNFDPNNLPESDWKRLGLSEKQIKSIKKFESKGGVFRNKEDLKKMYCIKNELYVSLEPFITITSVHEKQILLTESTSMVEPANVKKSIDQIIPKVPSKSIIELNTADSAMLTSIKGIGPFYAKSIIKYRNSIGGFVVKEQLLEIWKFDQEKLKTIESFITVDPSKIKKININSCEAMDLKNAYINWTIANAIVNYRKNHGKYKALDEIKKTDLVDDQTYRKIVPYLVTE
jgi:competence protein ComEA